MSVVRTEQTGDVAVITLDRPPVNAMDLDLLRGLTAAVDAFVASDATAAVLTGTGRSFCAGVDLRLLLEGGADYVREFLPTLSDCFRTLFTASKPVVAALNGHALAGGCILTAACDLRLVAAGDATVGVTELPVGVPFPSWALEIMRHSTPPQHLSEVVLTGRRYTAEQGLARGLVDELVPAGELVERAVAAARELGGVPPATFAHTKRQLRRPAVERVERHGRDVDAQAEALWTSPEIAQAIRAFLDARVGRRSG